MDIAPFTIDQRRQPATEGRCVMEFKDFLTLFTDYSNDTGCVLGDLEDSELADLRNAAYRLLYALQEELAARAQEEEERDGTNA